MNVKPHFPQLTEMQTPLPQPLLWEPPQTKTILIPLIFFIACVSIRYCSKINYSKAQVTSSNEHVFFAHKSVGWPGVSSRLSWTPARIRAQLWVGWTFSWSWLRFRLASSGQHRLLSSSPLAEACSYGGDRVPREGENMREVSWDLDLELDSIKTGQIQVVRKYTPLLSGGVMLQKLQILGNRRKSGHFCKTENLPQIGF